MNIHISTEESLKNSSLDTQRPRDGHRGRDPHSKSRRRHDRGPRGYDVDRRDNRSEDRRDRRGRDGRSHRGGRRSNWYNDEAKQREARIKLRESVHNPLWDIPSSEGEDDISEDDERERKGTHKKKHSKKKSKSSKSKKKSKRKKRKRSYSSGSSSSRRSSDDKQGEETNRPQLDISSLLETKAPPAEAPASIETSDSEEEDSFGPQPVVKSSTALETGKANYGTDMLRGEANAIAQYVKQDMRIPRRGEVGMTGDEISRFEDVGYVMSGSRHKKNE
mmetsp:Transcript_31823/g.50796  ORF Transcript_31823/g.50796 Transcript_31823/m.50796 type:complete len:277 (+) Transcript_31823:110-940(+)